MASSWFIRIPTHYFIIMITLSNDTTYVHLHLIITIFLILLIRLLNFLKISDFLKQNEKTISDKFPSQMVEKKIQILTFFQMAADIIQFILFVYPLSFVLIVFQYKQGQALNLIWLVSAWQTDNGALFMGSMFGKTLFCPKISPNKTWEGVSGGIFLSVFSSLILSQVNFLSFITLDDLHTKHFLMISLIVSIASIFGDLIESFIKRVADVKDSGALFPGHGGILDRTLCALVLHSCTCTQDYSLGKFWSKCDINIFMLQEKIKNYIKQRECATARIKTLLRQPCTVTFTSKQEFSPHKTIHQFQPIKNVNTQHSVLKLRRNLSRQRSPSLKFDQVITNGIPNIVRRVENSQKNPQLKQRANDVNLQTQFTTLPTQRLTSQWFGKKRSQSNAFFVTLSTLFDDDLQYHKQRISKHCFMENRLNENQFVMTDFSPILNI